MWSWRMIFAGVFVMGLLLVGWQGALAAPAKAPGEPVSEVVVLNLGAQPTAISARKSYVGARKGVTWSNGEWHHYVEFDTSGRCGSDPVVIGPRPSSPWGYVKGSNCTRFRAGYWWPSNWWDPMPAFYWLLTVSE
ncbi:MAG: hypothetical protein WAU05_12030 [Nitrospira sp.]